MLLLLASPCLAQPGPSAADLQTARAAFREGMELRTQGKMADALQRLRLAHELAHTPITALEFGRTLISSGRLVEGTEVLLEATRLPKAYDESAQATAARGEAARLASETAPKIATVRVGLEGSSKDTRITIDGEAVSLAALSMGRKLDPGAHDIVAANPRAEESRLRVELQPGETRDIKIELKPSPPPPVVAPPVVTPPVLAPLVVAPPPPPPVVAPPAESSPWKPVAIVGFGVAGVGAIVGTITGLVALGAANNAESACQGTRCPSDAFSRIESGRAAATGSTIAFAIGGAGLALGVTALVLNSGPGPRGTRESASLEPWLSVGSAGVRGSF